MRENLRFEIAAAAVGKTDETHGTHATHGGLV
jgi:hypothetical protein